MIATVNQIHTEACKVMDSRSCTHGTPEQTFARAAEIASVITNKPWTLEDILYALLSVKIARFQNDPTHVDNTVDGTNYWAMLQYELSRGEPV
jgi:hypothetical protein